MPFPASVVLVGQRQVWDYALREEERRALQWLGTTSPFNIGPHLMLMAFLQRVVNGGGRIEREYGLGRGPSI